MQFTAKTAEEAIKQGLSALEITQEQAEITVVQEGVKGLFGRVKTMAIVEITKKEACACENGAEKKPSKKQECQTSGNEEEMLTKMLELLGVEATIEKSYKGEKEILNINCADSSFVIGYRGEVLDALQTIVGATANIGNKDYKKVVVDCENYRGRREETLIKLAHRLEEKATEIRREVQLEPMCAFERRIIHTALSDSKTVTTKSDGKEPERFVVIVPNDKDEFSKPYNAGRNDKKDRNSKGRRDDRRGGRKPSFKKSGFTESKRVAPSGFGTYLGNSLKDNK